MNRKAFDSIIDKLEMLGIPSDKAIEVGGVLSGVLSAHWAAKDGKRFAACLALAYQMGVNDAKELK